MGSDQVLEWQQEVYNKQKHQTDQADSIKELENDIKALKQKKHKQKK